MNNKRILLIATKGVNTNILYNAINNEFGIHKVIIENKESRVFYLKRRIKKLGILKVMGQLLFQIIIVKYLIATSTHRKNQIINEHQLNTKEIEEEKVEYVHSINSEIAINKIRELNPQIIIVCGTRIISSEVLEKINCKFINIHTGITPLYRGVHGGYWALANNDKDNFGVTVHYIDKGVDTGKIIDRSVVDFTPKDNFTTYPLLQIAAGIKLLSKVLNTGQTESIQTTEKGKIWYHPTLLQYISNRFLKKVK